MICTCNNPEHYHPMPSPREEELVFAKEMVDAAERALKNAREEMQRIKRETFPEEPHQSIIQFSLRFKRNGSVYSYAAIKIVDKMGGPASWFITGQTSAHSWKSLVRFIESKYIVTNPTIVMTGEPIRGFYGRE